VVVQGTGGVSLYALQLARLAGARVIVTSRSGDKLERAVGLGASQGIHTREHPDWAARVLLLTGGRGADQVLDVVGGGGRLKVVRLQAVSAGSREDLESLGRALAEHEARPVVDRVFPFDEARAAFEYLASGAQFGKVVISFP
jgi:NADPH:quinone reductase-like Zn-dependent oxidoreductase